MINLWVRIKLLFTHRTTYIILLVFSLILCFTYIRYTSNSSINTNHRIQNTRGSSSSTTTPSSSFSSQGSHSSKLLNGYDTNDVSSFLVIGDWGMHGAPAQTRVGNAMLNTQKELATSFVISCGDHFYDNGILNETDKDFITGFENVYSKELGDWYLVLGNHDVRGSVKAQIGYSKHSQHWDFPNNYYYKDFIIPQTNSNSNSNSNNSDKNRNKNNNKNKNKNKKNEKNDESSRSIANGVNGNGDSATTRTNRKYYRMIFIDTNSIMCNHNEIDKLDRLESDECNETWFTMPKLFEKNNINIFDNFVSRNKQLEWLIDIILKSNENDNIEYIMIVGHHPLWSQGPHGIPQTFNSYMLPILQLSNKIVTFLCGHNHGLEHYIWYRNKIKFAFDHDDVNFIESNTNYENLENMHVIMSGAGGATLHDMSSEIVESQLDFVKLGYIGIKTYGFVSVHVTMSWIKVIYWDTDNNILYQSVIIDNMLQT